MRFTAASKNTVCLLFNDDCRRFPNSQNINQFLAPVGGYPYRLGGMPVGRAIVNLPEALKLIDVLAGRNIAD